VADDWVFSDMTASDLPDVVIIERACFANPWTGPLFLQELDVSFSRIVIARRAAGPIAGYLCRWFVADEVHVLNVAVAPAYRGQGLGAALVGEALREARAAHA